MKKSFNIKHRNFYKRGMTHSGLKNCIQFLLQLCDWYNPCNLLHMSHDFHTIKTRLIRYLPLFIGH